ncbi:MAG: PRTRC system protein E, partial [Burkholderiaceae bacterium]|nr:PRTRC system protein E [Burkholderiaceae bacterium]
MGMFTELYPLAVSTRLAMLVTADAERGLMTISVMPRPKQDCAAKLATDLTLTATPEEFDTGFVTALTGYRTELVPLLEQAAVTRRAIEAEKANLQKNTKPPTKPAATAVKPAPQPAPRCAEVEEGGEREVEEDDTNPNDDP